MYNSAPTYVLLLTLLWWCPASVGGLSHELIAFLVDLDTSA
jgi:hypothetical protein